MSKIRTSILFILSINRALRRLGGSGWIRVDVPNILLWPPPGLTSHRLAGIFSPTFSRDTAGKGTVGCSSVATRTSPSTKRFRSRMGPQHIPSPSNKTAHDFDARDNSAICIPTAMFDCFDSPRVSGDSAMSFWLRPSALCVRLKRARILSVSNSVYLVFLTFTPPEVDLKCLIADLCEGWRCVISIAGDEYL